MVHILQFGLESFTPAWQLKTYETICIPCLYVKNMEECFRMTDAPDSI